MGDIVIPIELIDGRRLRAFKNALKAAIDALPKIEKQVNNEYKQRVKQGLEDIAEEAIDMFYESYSPHMYHRTNDLYNTYKVIVTDDRWAIDYLLLLWMDLIELVVNIYIIICLKRVIMVALLMDQSIQILAFHGIDLDQHHFHFGGGRVRLFRQNLHITKWWQIIITIQMK